MAVRPRAFIQILKLAIHVENLKAGTFLKVGHLVHKEYRYVIEMIETMKRFE
jgi:hypothetical protein